MIKAIIFDMDGVLFDTERLLKKFWLQVADDMGFTLTENELRQLRGASPVLGKAMFFQWYGDRVDYMEARARRGRYLEEYLSSHPLPEKKGLKELLPYLNKHNIPFAIATATDRKRASKYWKMAGITDWITASVCGDEVSSSKPDPEIFLTAAEKLGVPIEDCMIIEDSINGLKAARASKAYSCMVPDLTPYSEELKPICDYVCEDLTACIALLESLNQ